MCACMCIKDSPHPEGFTVEKYTEQKEDGRMMWFSIPVDQLVMGSNGETVVDISCEWASLLISLSCPIPDDSCFPN